jgi:hypothetical protein
MEHPMTAVSASPGLSVLDSRERRLWDGTQDPSSATPPRAPFSVRRTTSIDMLRPDGLEGPLRLVGRGRDLKTGAGGATRVLDTAGMDLTVDYHGGRLITAARTDPDLPGVAALVGRSALSRFRSAARAALGEERAATVLAQLLDDVPVATIVSSAALARTKFARRAGGSRTSVDDICAGWRADGLLATRRRASGPTTPLNEFGPRAGNLSAGDPLGWHPMPALEGLAMRRLRRLDVVAVRPGADPARLAAGFLPGQAGFDPPAGMAFLVDALVRDSFQDPHDTEIVVHEFTVRAALAADGAVLAAAAGIGVTPGPQCPQARPSAARLAGRQLAGLREAVAHEFVGPTTCTHLNDTLRTLGDLPRLLAAARD